MQWFKNKIHELFCQYCAVAPALYGAQFMGVSIGGVKAQNWAYAPSLRLVSHGQSDRVRLSFFQADLIGPALVLYDAADVRTYVSAAIQSCPVHQKQTDGGIHSICWIA